MPISCHFRDCKALLVTSLTHVCGAIASVQTFTFYLYGFLVAFHSNCGCIFSRFDTTHERDRHPTQPHSHSMTAKFMLMHSIARQEKLKRVRHTSCDGMKTTNVERVLDHTCRRRCPQHQRRVGLQPATSGCRLVLRSHASDYILGACALTSGDVVVAQIPERALGFNICSVRPNILTACNGT